MRARQDSLETWLLPTQPRRHHVVHEQVVREHAVHVQVLRQRLRVPHVGAGHRRRLELHHRPAVRHGLLHRRTSGAVVLRASDDGVGHLRGGVVRRSGGDRETLVGQSSEVLGAEWEVNVDVRRRSW